MATLTKRISILGSGQMGSALAYTFLNEGYHVTVWNRTIDKATPLVASGAIVTDSPASCVHSGTLVIICLVSDAVVLDVLRGVPTLANRTIINYTSSRSHGISETADLVLNKLGGSGYLHGFITSPPSKVRAREAAIFYGGLRPLFAEYQGICETLGKAIWLSADLQQVSRLEIASLSMVAGVFAAFFQSLALAPTDLISGVDFTSQILLPQLQNFNEIWPRLAQQDQARSYRVGEDGISVGTALSVVSDVMEMAENSGISSRLLRGLQGLLSEGVDAGKGSEDLSAVIEILRNAD